MKFKDKFTLVFKQKHCMEINNVLYKAQIICFRRFIQEREITV